VARDRRRKAPPHGTRDRYYYGDGCRCEACREANARYQRERYARLNLDAHPHGVVALTDDDGNVIAEQHPLFD